MLMWAKMVQFGLIVKNSTVKFNVIITGFCGGLRLLVHSELTDTSAQTLFTTMHQTKESFTNDKEANHHKMW